MSIRAFKKLDSSQLYDLHKDLIIVLLEKIQSEYDASLYSTKTPYDKLDCKICGGCYTRNARSKHYASKLHKNHVATLCATLDDFYTNTIDNDQDVES